jgi:hypothetical protein
LKLTAKRASWTGVKNNSGYTLKITQGKKTLRTVQVKRGRTSWKIPKKLFKRGNSYRFTLLAKGSGNFRNSKTARSKALKIKKK